MLGIQARKGSLDVGCDADLTLLDDELFVRRCYVGGEVAWEAAAEEEQDEGGSKKKRKKK